MLRILSIFISLSMFACSGTKEIKEIPESTTENSIKKGIKVIAIKKGPCFGNCPVFTMELFKGGKVLFKGEKNVLKQGNHEAQISTQKLDSILQLFRNSDFTNWDSEYESLIPDLPRISIYFYNGKSEKTITGKEKRPEGLKEIQKELEQLAADLGFIVDKNKKSREKILYDQIIIKPKEGLMLSRWFKEQSKIGIRLNNRISASDNLWLITYSQDRYAPAEILKMLQDDPDIIFAEFNKELVQQ